MRKVSLSFLALAFVINLSCNQNEIEFRSEELSPARIIDVGKELGLFTIDQAISGVDDGYILFDRTRQSVFLVDPNFDRIVREFNFKGSLLEGFELYGFDILEDRLFLKSSQGFAVFSLEGESSFLGVFKNPFYLSNHMYNFKNQNFSTFLSEKGITIVSFAWDDIVGFTEIEKVIQIPRKRPTNDVDLSGWLLGIDETLVYIDEWSGEYFVVDLETRSLFKEARLPLAGPLDENYELDENNIYFGTYKNAYSVTSIEDNSFYVLREIDWEVSNSIEIDLSLDRDKKRIRRRVHHFNKKFEIIESFWLENYTNAIYYSDGKLIANHTGEEELFIYDLER